MCVIMVALLDHGIFRSWTWSIDQPFDHVSILSSHNLSILDRDRIFGPKVDQIDTR